MGRGRRRKRSPCFCVRRLGGQRAVGGDGVAGTSPEMPRLQPGGDAELTEGGMVRLERGSGTTLGRGRPERGLQRGRQARAVPGQWLT